MIEDPVFSVSRDGIYAPSYEEILEFLKSRARTIFGNDIDLDSDTQDGQLIAIFASAINDTNSQAIAVYNAFNPATAVGVALDSVVKVNGLARRNATHSQVDLLIAGTFGTVITNGIAKDSLENKWLLPATVTIPQSGQITVTATAQEVGAVEAMANTITKIDTPTLGWTSVTNPLQATVGISVQTDEELRNQQSISTMQPSVSLWEGVVSSVLALQDVLRVSGINNSTSSTSDEGIPAHTFALVVEGGVTNDIAYAIGRTKGQGVGTYGSTSVTVADGFGYNHTIKFSRPTYVQIGVTITIQASTGWVSAHRTDIKNRIKAFINNLPIGQDVNIVRVLSSAAMENGVPDTTFIVEDIVMGVVGQQQSAGSVTINWDQAAVITDANITIQGVE